MYCGTFVPAGRAKIHTSHNGNPEMFETSVWWPGMTGQTQEGDPRMQDLQRKFCSRKGTTSSYLFARLRNHGRK